jgi:Cu+-exporting ATPase
MILPVFSFFEDVLTYPKTNGIFSAYIIIGFIATLFTMWVFGRKCYINAIINYRKFKLLNMDSLVTLGSISAFIMSLLLMIVYQV